MKASIVDLRYKMNEVIKALERREEVTIHYHGKVKGRIVAMPAQTEARVTDHPYFGMSVNEEESVKEVMDRLRESRVRDI